MTDLSALFSQQAYVMDEQKSKDERINKINETIKDTGFKANSEKSNRDMLYLQNDKGQTHIAVKGTSNKQDVGTDLFLALGAEKHNKHFKKKTNRINNLVKKTIVDDPTQEIFLSGHSLGGSVVNDAMKNKKSVRENVTANTFNAGASPFVKKASKKVEKELKDGRLTNHRITTDAVSASSAVNPLAGNTKTYKPKQNKHIKKVPKFLNHVFDTVEQLRVHSIDNFVKDKYIKKNKK
tara:strand:+ start:2857 stop:3567 length:711 start_codon:yes stop_codon:yes gene_type:complete